jgi:hypothetical protein
MNAIKSFLTALKTFYINAFIQFKLPLKYKHGGLDLASRKR